MKPHTQDWVQAVILTFLVAFALVILGFMCGCFGSARLPDGPSVTSGLPQGLKPPSTPPVQQVDPLDEARQKVADAEGALAKAKAELDQSKRQAEERSQAAWQYWTRLIAALGIPLALATGALGAWFGMGRLALPIAGSIVVFCVALLAFGEALPWLRIIGPILGAVALVGIVVVLLLRQRQALTDTARLGDALETGVGVKEAKLAAKGAQLAAGMWQVVQKARGKS